MSVSRLLPSEEAAELLDLTREIADRALAPRACADEAAETFPRDVFHTLGRAGLLGLPYPAEFGGGGQPYEVYLQVVEEIAARWASIGVGVSVHALSCFALATHGMEEQKARWLPELLEGELLGAYCLSESHAGSDPAAMRTSARRSTGTHTDADGGADPGAYVLRGEKAWTTHGGHADFYTVMARTSEHRSRGVSCFLVPAGSSNLSADPPERKMGLTAQATATMRFDDVRVPAAQRIGDEGQGLAIALASLDAGRLGIAAVAVGLAQGALDDALAYAKERETFGRPIIDHQGLAFLLADMAAAVESARATVLAAARRKDAGLPYSREASIAKLTASETAMRVTTDAVQVFGGAGYTRDFPVERYMREAKVMQIFEGTNQIQRMVISRDLARGPAGPAAHVLSQPCAMAHPYAEARA
ncbi:acyl-CoA dehydrogenase family protein [Streptomyces boluensis]|uniref:Acyl-CoA dehydrogenase n=1 Tax=Streptomyces boluensis TaxID=1775135 RepID=A0A964XLT3_9ACTN|nr:acyl-CoA dehydrogenase family protein [Streptomyces boluensis]NBE51863.1 acyl-CoA dehydrogenase [Streptomyces boluensis]